jgi:predicted site-specific integrase-resolvase
MAKLTITESAKAAGIGRATLYRHIKEGKISCEIDKKGQKVIDTAELIRVYGEIRDTETSHENSKRHETGQDDTTFSVMAV